MVWWLVLILVGIVNTEGRPCLRGSCDSETSRLIPVGQRGPNGATGVQGATGIQGNVSTCFSTPLTVTSGFAYLVVATPSACGWTPFLKISDTVVIMGGDPVPVIVTGTMYLSVFTVLIGPPTNNPVSVSIIQPVGGTRVYTLYATGLETQQLAVVQEGIAVAPLVTTSVNLTSEDSGNVVLARGPATSSDTYITLPRPAPGLHLRVIWTGQGIGSGKTIIQSPIPGIIQGNLFNNINIPLPTAVNSATSCTIAPFAAVGNWYEFWSDGIFWMISGIGGSIFSVVNCV